MLGSKQVSDEALLKANDTIRKMFAYRHDILKAMIADGARLVVLGRKEKLSDLPEFKDAKNKAGSTMVRYLDYTPDAQADGRARGERARAAERAVRGQVHGGERVRQGLVPRDRHCGRSIPTSRSGARSSSTSCASSGWTSSSTRS